MNPRSDGDLLVGFLAGDAADFGELFTRHSDHLWAVSLRICANPTDAADALQDGVLRAMRGAAGFQGRSQVSTWLHRIVANAAIDLVRRRHPQVSIDDHPAAEAQGHVLAEPDWVMSLDIERALRELPPGQRLAVYLVDYEGWSVAEAAQQLGVAPGTIKSRCARGRARLAPVLAPYSTRPGNHEAAPGVQPEQESPPSERES